MASEKQLEANRANAKHSTGPRSSRGKARSRMNAVKLGLTATKIIIPGEKSEEFEALQNGLMVDFAPANTIELELVDRLAGLLWRLRRWPAAEAGLLKGCITKNTHDLSLLTDEELDQLITLYGKAKITPPGREMSNLINEQMPAEDHENKNVKLAGMLSIFSRYEAGLMNAVIKTLTLLRGLQSARVASEAGAKTIDAQPRKRGLTALQ